MKSKIALLLTGVALGLLITRLFDKTSPPANPAPETQPSIADTQTDQKEIITPVVTLKDSKIAPDRHPKLSALAPKQPEKTYGVRIEESTVRELEDEKEYLRQHAFADRRDDGWQIHILEQDQALLHSGLSDGDIITHESIDSQMRMADRSALVTRFVALLKYIER